MRLSIQSRRAALQGIAKNTYHFCGIRPTPNGPELTSTVAEIDTSMSAADQLQSALTTAQHYWPNAHAWQIVGSDIAERQAATTETPSTLIPQPFKTEPTTRPLATPPGIITLRQCEVLGTFSTS